MSDQTQTSTPTNGKPPKPEKTALMSVYQAALADTRAARDVAKDLERDLSTEGARIMKDHGKGPHKVTIQETVGSGAGASVVSVDYLVTFQQVNHDVRAHVVRLSDLKALDDAGLVKALSNVRAADTVVQAQEKVESNAAEQVFTHYGRGPHKVNVRVDGKDVPHLVTFQRVNRQVRAASLDPFDAIT